MPETACTTRAGRPEEQFGRARFAGVKKSRAENSMDSEFEIKNAVIESADITTRDRGFLDCWLTLDYGGSGQGFGGWTLYLPKSWKHHKVESVAGHHIFRIMEIAGVEKWDQLVGKTIRVKANHSKIHAIGHIVKHDWYCPEDDFKRVKSE